MRLRRRFGCVFAALLLGTVLAGSVLAQDQDQDQNTAPPPANVPMQQGDPGQGGQQQDPPGRVARVQYMTGQVSMQPGGVNDWVAASMNRPLTTADRVWTDKDSRAELNVGDGFLRMNSETSVTLTNVSDSTVQIELDQGTLALTVRHLQSGEVYEVDTPNFAFTVMKTGVYRFDVYPSQDESWVTVRSGYGQATGKGPAVRVNSDMQIRFRADNSLQHTAYAAPARDGFEDWAQVRDKRLDDSVSARYVSPGVIGYQDLDAYGNWVQAPTYGAVWVPNSVPAGWAPYRFGHWAWIAPWGWTWVDDQPWGFAPFHYGRWVSYGGGWGWAPGPYGGYWNPYYAPALVGWIGGPGFGIGFGFGGGWGFGIGVGFGWYPLGWGQPFYPRYCGWGHGGWYRGGGYVSNAYLRNVNITNTRITNINNITNNYYHNNLGNVRNTSAVMRNGVTSASRSAFTSGAAVNKVGGAVPASAIGKGQLMSTANVNPTKSSVLGGQTPRTTGVPSSSASRGVVTNARPPAGPAKFGGTETAAAHTNSAPGANHGAATEASRGTTANSGAAQNASRSQASGNNELARATTPSNPAGGHYVPRPPSAGGMATTNHGQTSSATNGQASSTHNVPRPPASNDSFARSNSGTSNNHATANVAQNNNAGTSNNQHYGANNSESRSSQSYPPSRSTGTQQHSSPSHQAAPQGGSHSSGSSSERSAMSVPRPPSGYSYHAAPGNSASSSYGAHGASSYSGGSSRSSYAGSSYGAGSRSAYSGYGASRSYGSTPTYSASRSYGSSPMYSGRSMGSYSAPHSSGGSSGGYHASGGGGGYHGGGGGSHSSGGGGHSGGGHGR
jgi:FecR protein